VIYPRCAPTSGRPFDDPEVGRASQLWRAQIAAVQLQHIEDVQEHIGRALPAKHSAHAEIGDTVVVVSGDRPEIQISEIERARRNGCGTLSLRENSTTESADSARSALIAMTIAQVIMTASVMLRKQSSWFDVPAKQALAFQLHCREPPESALRYNRRPVRWAVHFTTRCSNAEAKDLAAKQLARLAARKAKKAAEAAALAVVNPKPAPAPLTKTPEQLRDRVRALLRRRA
jgi:hypothetical protein